MYTPSRCKYYLLMPDGYINIALCTAYADAKCPSGMSNLHYPECRESNCPLRNPELLNGGTLDETAD